MDAQQNTIKSNCLIFTKQKDLLACKIRAYILNQKDFFDKIHQKDGCP
jgi:hypothetical protein